VGNIYRLVRLLGAGGMGEVWEAQHERTRGRVALKVLLPEMGKHEEVLRRFQREVEITSGINHPNIVRVSDADSLPDGRPYLVMEFLEGSDLQKVAGGRAIPLQQVLEIVDQAAMGLHAAHAHSVIHRDLKPANLFLVPLPGTSRQLVKILDFGISKAVDGLSKLTHTRSVMGTPYYMAPEQATGGITTMDARADQFSLAAIAYELLTGRMAFEGDGMVNVIYKVVNESPPPFSAMGLSLPPGVELTILRGLSKRANDRFPTVLEFSEALKRAAAGEGSDAVAAHAAAPPSQRTRILPTPPATTTLRQSAAQIESVRGDDLSPRRGGGKARLWIAGGVVAAVAVVAVVALRSGGGEKEGVTSQPAATGAAVALPPPAPQAPVPAEKPVEPPNRPAVHEGPAHEGPAHEEPAHEEPSVEKPPGGTSKPPVAESKSPSGGTSRHSSRSSRNSGSKVAGGTSQPTHQPGPINDDL
jgi:serine/threonine-protein kinase